MPGKLRLACINIEHTRHIPQVGAFIEKHQPDVLCLQELCERDIPFFEGLMGGKVHYTPMGWHRRTSPPQLIGIALVSRLPVASVTQEYYVGDRAELPESGIGTLPGPNARYGLVSRALLTATVAGYRIGTTHFTWSAEGSTTPEQLHDVAKLLALAKTQAEGHGELAFCGDFNAPRGRETFAQIAAQFTDAIPPHYTTSIDAALHQAGALPYMVDGLFHTPGYTAEDVTLHSGVSDHMAITATLARA